MTWWEVALTALAGGLGVWAPARPPLPQLEVKFSAADVEEEVLDPYENTDTAELGFGSHSWLFCEILAPEPESKFFLIGMEVHQEFAVNKERGV